MSSSTSLSRTRSLQKPTSGSNGSSRGNIPSARNEARNTSPSRLPVKPTTMTTRSMVSNTTTSSTTTARRIASSTITGRTASGTYSKVPSARPDNAGNTAAKASRPLARASSTRQVSSSSTTAGSIPSTRSASTTVNRPRSSGGPPPTASNRSIGHSRSKSTVTSLTAATTLRPATQSRISQTSSTSSGGRTSPAPSAITTASSKAPTRQTRSQTHTRTKSQSQPSTSTSTSTSQQPASRPAFNTHQQHYSPAKSLAPKPLTSTFLAPPSPSKLPANVAISAETSRLQTELLQLSLLHRDATAVDSEWRDSARQKLGARFARLNADHDALIKLERHGVEARNIAALVRWGKSNRSGLGLEEKVQILDEVLNGVWQLGEPGGRYQRVVADFEVWAERMASIIAAQRSGDVEGLIAGDEVQFLGDLDRTWARDCESLLRKLEGWRAALRDLGDVNDDSIADSGLARMVCGGRTLVEDMLAELAVMAQIERDAARTENEWITRMNQAIEDEDDDTPAARAYVPLWKLAA